MTQEAIATAYGEIDILPPELLLVERVFFATESDECVQSARQMKRLLAEHGLGAPSRKRVSFNWSERHMRKAFGGARIPAWAAQKEVAE